MVGESKQERKRNINVIEMFIDSCCSTDSSASASSEAGRRGGRALGGLLRGWRSVALWLFPFISPIRESQNENKIKIEGVPNLNLHPLASPRTLPRNISKAVSTSQTKPLARLPREC